MKIYLETKPQQQVCPCCGAPATHIHDYRTQTIKDLPFQLKNCYLVLKKRKYSCNCGKHFYEKYSFLPRYQQRTSRMTAFIASTLHIPQSIKETARQANVSTSTVNRILDTIHYTRDKLPKALSIDEFKGNANTGKYHFIRQMTWAIEGVRKRIQKTMPPNLRKYYKRSHKLILTPYYKLKDEDKKACDLMLLYNDDLRAAHFLKKSFTHCVKIQNTLNNVKTFTTGLKWLKSHNFQNSKNAQRLTGTGLKGF